MNFIDSIKICFKKYRTFSGRSSRPEFWYFFLFFLIICFASTISTLGFSNLFNLGALGIIPQIVILSISLVFYSVGARRLHDINRSGLWQIIPIIIGFLGDIPGFERPLLMIGLLFQGLLIFWYATPGQKKDNQFGKSIYKKTKIKTLKKQDKNFFHQIYTLFSKFKNFFISILGSGGEILSVLIGVLFFIGSFYFLYLSFKLGSVGMFILGIFLIPIAGLIGAYSFIFGVPQWILSLFG